ncbi:alpha/beta hydrolase [Streptomyces melanogenes]|uniref:alpha/beta hydrolase n=1 Tax=Streptomyces melanogenes TaxID=67326 RepID=UPI00379CE68B
MAYAYDRQLAPWVTKLPPIDYRDPRDAREAAWARQYQRQPRAVPDSLWVREYVLPSATEAPGARIRVYGPALLTSEHSALPAVLYFHGGGFVTGDLETGHDECMWIAASLGVVVINVNYRLAPYHPYPVAVMDAHAAFHWALTHADAVGIDRRRIAVAGHGSGAGIAAALCLLTRERISHRPCFQLLGNPLLDDRLETTSARLYVDTPVRDRTQLAYSWFHYVGGGAGGPEVPVLAAPARAADLRGLPPTHVSVCEFDPARDEAITYAQRLTRAGVSTELHHYPGTFADCAALLDADVTQRMRQDGLFALGRALLTPGSG